ncbi:hypothetical protein PCYB_082030 [Plasmodium cynomolgi strain B]|uniref:Uncharacterized protein n=1 Tax=Plasmodium cynomolgi (strain B) TaxID=1120755 RepID=K6VA66_PLACD|nr:hypothetical protein PCYB_082030 [Plasmodium cynomolgi strain B]GAB66042.1 hypothetical protein PCYB_082030 [Plasmodium cynomolgi strain B]
MKGGLKISAKKNCRANLKKKIPLKVLSQKYCVDVTYRSALWNSSLCSSCSQCAETMATEERVKLLVAARKGIYEDVVSLSKLQIPLGDYVQPPHNRTAFWYSCRNGSLKMARIILKKGSNINHKDANGISPLHISVKYGHLNIAKFLIENNANVDITDNVRMKGWSSKEGPYNIGGMLVEREGQSPIFYAIINKHYDIVKLLIENGADVQMKDHNNASVYDYADFSGRTKLSSYILYKSNIQ